MAWSLVPRPLPARSTPPESVSRHAFHDDAVQSFRQGTTGFTVAYMRDLVERGEIPDTLVQATLCALDGRPELSTLSDVEFLVAATEARPEFAAILASAAGRAWTQKAARKVTLSMIGGAARSLLGWT